MKINIMKLFTTSNVSSSKQHVTENYTGQVDLKAFLVTAFLSRKETGLKREITIEKKICLDRNKKQGIAEINFNSPI